MVEGNTKVTAPRKQHVSWHGEIQTPPPTSRRYLYLQLKLLTRWKPWVTPLASDVCQIKRIWSSWICGPPLYVEPFLPIGPSCKKKLQCRASYVGCLVCPRGVPIFEYYSNLQPLWSAYEYMWNSSRGGTRVECHIFLFKNRASHHITISTQNLAMQPLDSLRSGSF